MSFTEVSFKNIKRNRFMVLLIFNFLTLSVLLTFSQWYFKSKNAWARPLANQFESSDSRKDQLIRPEPSVTRGDTNKIFTYVPDINYIKYYDIYYNGNWKNDEFASKSDTFYTFHILKDSTKLEDGRKYFYRIRIKHVHPDSIQEHTSKIEWSFQDATFPEVHIDNLSYFKTSNKFYVPFKAHDAVCDSINQNIERAALFYRPEPNSDPEKEWKSLTGCTLKYNATQKIIMSEITTQDSIPFQCPPELGNGYYEVYIKARDWAYNPDNNGPNGNENPFDTTTMAWAKLWVDTILPTSKIDIVDRIQASLAFSILYSADDPKSKERKYESGISKVDLFYNYKQSDSSKYIFKNIPFDSQKHNGDTSEVHSFFNFFALQGNGIYEFFTIAMDSAGNSEADSSLISVTVDTTRPVIQWINAYENSSMSKLLSSEWQNRDDAPFFIWDNPQNLSGDSFFIIIKQNFTSKIHLDTVVTDSFIDLDALGIHLDEGEHEFKVVAKSGAGLISDTMNYFIRYDTTVPSTSIEVSQLEPASPEEILVNYQVDDKKINGTESGIHNVTLFWSYEKREGSYSSDSTHHYYGDRASVRSSFHFKPDHNEGLYYFYISAQDSATNVAYSLKDSARVIRLIAPNGGEHWRDNVRYNISWSPSDTARTTILISFNAGISFADTIAKDTLINGAYTWIPKTSKNEELCKIKICLTYPINGKRSEDTSDNNFIFDNQPPQNVRVVFPNGGESIAQGVDTLIVWDPIKDNFCPKDGITVNVYLLYKEKITLIASTDSIGDFIYQITPDDTCCKLSKEISKSIDSDSCKIRIEVFDLAGNIRSDESDNYFSIKPYPFVSWITLSDLDTSLSTLEDSMKYAMPGWCNQDTILCSIKSGASPPEQVKFWISYDSCSGIVDWDSIKVSSDSVGIKVLPLLEEINTRYQIECQLRNSTGISNKISKAINLDISPPKIDGIQCPQSVNYFTIPITISGNDTAQELPNLIIKKPHRILLSENPDFSLNHSTTKLYWGGNETVSFKLSDGEGEKIIYCKVGDLAGNWSNVGSMAISVDVSSPTVEFDQTMDSFIHLNQPGQEIIKVLFSEDVIPKTKWSNSIDIWDVYKNTKISKSWYNLEPSNGDTTGLITIISNRAFDPSRYQINVSNFKDVLGSIGVAGTSSFYVYLEKENGGTVTRILPQNIGQTWIDVIKDSLPVDAVVKLEPEPDPEPSSSDWAKLKEFLALENTCWTVQFISDDDLIADKIYSFNSKANLRIYSISQANEIASGIKSLKMVHKDYNSNYWELIQNSNLNINSNTLQIISNEIVSGKYCVAKVTDKDSAYCYPNPFATTTKIRFYLSEGDNISDINIYDPFGNLVIRKEISSREEGMKEIEWNGLNGKGEPVANGGYICVIKKGTYVKIYVLN